MARTMLNEHRTPRHFWADAIRTVCYISNQIFLLSILYLTSFKLRFGRKPSVSHLRHFGCKCFVLKCGNLDKFEFCSLVAFYLDISLMADLTVFITLRLTPLLSYVMLPSTTLLLILMMFLSVQVIRKWMRASL
jgi:hypothetical protein